jgi:hypothetical protein
MTDTIPTSYGFLFLLMGGFFGLMLGLLHSRLTNAELKAKLKLAEKRYEDLCLVR